MGVQTPFCALGDTTVAQLHSHPCPRGFAFCDAYFLVPKVYHRALNNYKEQGTGSKMEDGEEAGGTGPRGPGSRLPSGLSLPCAFSASHTACPASAQ